MLGMQTETVAEAGGESIIGGLLSLSPVISLGTLLLATLSFALYRVNREHTRAARARYAPALDIHLQPLDERIVLSIINRGGGVARNIILKVNVQMNGQVYRHKSIFKDISLPPDHGLKSRDPHPTDVNENQVDFSPIIWTKLTMCEKSTDESGESISTVSLLELLQEGLEESDSAYLAIEMECTDTLRSNDYQEPVYSEYISNSVDGWNGIFEERAEIRGGSIIEWRRWNTQRVWLAGIWKRTLRWLSRRRTLSRHTPPRYEAKISPIPEKID